MVQEDDIEVFDADDWEIQVDGEPLDNPDSFEPSPQWADEDEVMESMYGEVGFFERRLSSKGEVKVTLLFNADTNKRLATIAKDRKKVPVYAVCRKNKERYSVHRVGLQIARLKPASFKVGKKGEPREYTFFGFGYKED